MPGCRVGESVRPRCIDLAHRPEAGQAATVRCVAMHEAMSVRAPARSGSNGSGWSLARATTFRSRKVSGIVRGECAWYVEWQECILARGQDEFDGEAAMKFRIEYCGA